MYKHQLEHLAKALKDYSNKEEAFTVFEFPPKLFLTKSFKQSEVEQDFGDMGVPGMPNKVRREEFEQAWKMR